MKKKIMVIDDDYEFLQIMSSFLIEKGYLVWTITEANQVYPAIVDFSPDLIILDVHLKEIDGQGICREIKNIYFDKTVPILLCTADQTIPFDNIESRADAFIRKPFTFMELSQKIHLLLSKSITPA